MTHKTPVIPKAITRTWAITGTVANPNPPEKDVYYNSNFVLGVEAPTMEEALQVARGILPTAVFTSCHHRGDIHVKV